jgi:hypothetical protein
MSIDRESFDRAVAFANDRAEGGRQLDIVRAEIEYAALDEARAANLLALAALSAGDERDRLIDQARVTLGLDDPTPEPAPAS